MTKNDAYFKLEQYIQQHYDNPNQKLYTILIDDILPNDKILIGIVNEYKQAVKKQ